MTAVGDQSPTDPDDLRHWLEQLPGRAVIVSHAGQASQKYGGSLCNTSGSYEIRHDSRHLAAVGAPFTLVWLPPVKDRGEG